MINGTITGIGNATAYLNTQGRQLGQNFQKELINRARALSIQLQKGISESVDKGAVPFTNRAVLFTYKKTGTGVTAKIIVKDLQAKYLYDVLVQPSAHEKYVPTSAARLTRQGNISGLKANLANGRYKVVVQNGKKRIIDTSQKKKNKRVIGVRESKRRQLIYDFYANAERGAMLILNDIRGTFTLRRQ